MQNKIDQLVLNANNEFTLQRNVISALVDYTRTADLFEFLEKTYQIQLHEIFVRIAICWDILGSYNNTIDYLNRALAIVPNVASLILYKSVLLQTLGKSDEAQKFLLRYKQISGKKQLAIYETFRLVFFYSTNLEREVLLIEINEFLEKYPKNVIVLYLRAMTYKDLSNTKAGTDIKGKSHKKNAPSEFLIKNETDIKEAYKLEPTDTDFLMRDGISNESLTKIFFMILPEMDNYQPKSLVNYSTFHSGLKVFYIIFKVIRMLKIKVEKKKLKAFYNNQLRLNKIHAEKEKFRDKEKDNRNVSPDFSNTSLVGKSNISDNTLKESGNESQTGNGLNKSTTPGNTSEVGNGADLNVNVTNNSLSANSISKDKASNFFILRGKTKSNGIGLNSERIPLNLKGGKAVNTIVNIKTNFEKENLDDIVKGIKKEFETKVKNLYRTVWVYNLKYNSTDIKQYNLEADVYTNHFLKNVYYSPLNLKDYLIHGIRQNCEYKKELLERSSKKSTSLSLNSNPRQAGGGHYMRSGSHVDQELISTIMNNNPSLRLAGENNSNSNRNMFNTAAQTNQMFPDLSVSAINNKPTTIQVGQEEESVTFSTEVNLLQQPKQNLKRVSSGSQPRKNLQYFKIGKLTLQKITSDIIKNEAILSRKNMHRPSFGIEWQKLNIITNPANEEEGAVKNSTNNQRTHTNPNQSQSSNLKASQENLNILVTNIQDNLIHLPNDEPPKSIRARGVIKKPIDYGKVGLPDDIMKKGNLVKPELINLAKNLELRIVNELNAINISKEQSAGKIFLNDSAMRGNFK